MTIEQRSVRMTAVTERMMCTSGFSTVAGRIMEDTRIETATTRLAAHKNERWPVLAGTPGIVLDARVRRTFGE